MTPSRFRFLCDVSEHKARFEERSRAGVAASWEGAAYRPRGKRGFATAAIAAERDGLVTVFRSGADRAVDGVELTPKGRAALEEEKALRSIAG